MIVDQDDFDDFLLQDPLVAGELNSFIDSFVLAETTKNFEAVSSPLNILNQNHILALDLELSPKRNSEPRMVNGSFTIAQTRSGCADDSKIHGKMLILPPPTPFVRNWTTTSKTRNDMRISFRREYNFRIGLSLHTDRMRALEVCHATIQNHGE